LTTMLKKVKGIPPERIPELLKIYEEEYDGFDDKLTMEGKTIGVANRENASWLSYYDERRIEIGSVAKWLEMDLARVKAKLYKNITEGYDFNLTEAGKQTYIAGEQEYIVRRTALLEVQELYEKFESAVESFKQRGYQLRNLTELKIAQLDMVEC